MNRFSSARALLITVALLAQPGTLYALGGDNSDPTNQIDSGTQDCQADLFTATRAYINARVNAFATCVNAFLDCESSSTTPLAQACRAALLEENVGACAKGVLDTGIETMGNTAAAITGFPSQALNHAHEQFVSTILSNCFGMSNPLDASSNGLGFAQGASDSDVFTDFVTKIPSGMGCEANAAVRTAAPLIDEIAERLKTFDNKCIAVSGGATLYADCSVNSDCGVTSGKCGKLAFAFKNGGEYGFPSCIESCDAGFYLSEDRLTCTPCDVGNYNNTANASSCTPCAAGSYATTTGSSQCTPCARGYAQPNPQQPSCTPCAAGTAQTQIGQSTCDQCTAGTYSGVAAVACLDCPVGTFSAPGEGSCTACAAGSYAASPASSSCASCPLGTFAEDSGRKACSPCAPGSIAASEGLTTCTACAAGTYAAEPQSSSCTPCAAGSYSAVAGARSCTPSPAGSFVSQPGQSAVTPCEPGTHAANAQSSSCSPCTAGTFSEIEGAINCALAPAGSFVSEVGQSAVTPCEPGTYSSDPGATSCAQCSKGTYAPARGSLACVTCPKGTIAAKAGAVACRVCASGKSNRARTKCTK